MVADSPIQIRSEKILVSLLDAINVQTEQPLLFYKCCLCSVAFASMEQITNHIQQVHHILMIPTTMNGSEYLLTSNQTITVGGHDQQQQKVAENAAAAAAMAALFAKTAAGIDGSDQSIISKLSSSTSLPSSPLSSKKTCRSSGSSGGQSCLRRSLHQIF